MEPARKEKGIVNGMSELRKEIFSWLHTLPPRRIKDIFTIREKRNVAILEKILNKRQADGKIITTQKVTEGSFSLLLNDNEECIYFRSLYRFKLHPGRNNKRNQQVAELAKQLYANLVISRAPPHYMSIRMSFLQDLQTCMDELSKNQLLYLAQLGGERIDKSAWFQTGDSHSFAEWIVYMFECQIKKAYAQFKEAKGKNIGKDLPYKCPTFYEYVKSNWMIDEKLESIFEKVIVQEMSRETQLKDQNAINAKKVHFKKCMDRLKDEYDPQEYLIQYYWLTDNPGNFYFQIFKKVAGVLFQNYKQWKENKPFDDWLEEQQRERKKKIEKRKKKRISKKENLKVMGNQQKQPSSQNQNSDLADSKMTQIEEKEVPILEKVQIELKTPQLKSKIEEPEQIEQKIISMASNQKEKQQKKINTSNKKIIRERINQYYESFTNELIQISSTYDKYRRVVHSVVYHFLKEQIISNLNQEELEMNHQWKLEVYGSASAGFSLRHSDIDLVLLMKSKRMTLEDIYYKIRLQPWAIDCKFIQAQIPIVTFKVNLYYSPIAHSELTSKQLKRAEGELLSVDLTLSTLGEPHSGIENTKKLKEIFENYPNIRSICIFLKQYFRIRSLNKPYTGGIGSFVLIILIHAILTRKNIIESKKGALHPDNYTMIKEISEFMELKFVPFESVISSKKNLKVEPDRSIHLNIVDPKTDQLLKTSAFHIDRIILELKSLKTFQQSMEETLSSMNINEKKHMKAYFLKQFNQFLYGSQ